ncbi:MAG: hypothetical protein HY264_07135 [Chloroflexi bacterium]|nr:hypothetical protein [Chloroflexota bacterium]
MTDHGAEAPIGPVLGAPRRSRDRTRVLLVAAIAVVVVGAGIGLAGNGTTESPSGSSSPRGSEGSSASDGPPSSPPEATPVAPTPNAGLGCAPVRLGAPPEFTISGDVGNLPAIGGVATTSAPDPSAPISTWPVPGKDTGIVLAGSAGLIVAADGDACIRYVIAEYRPADPALKGPFPIAFRTLNVSPPRSIVPLGPLPSGDWVVRIVAYFSTGIAGQESANVVERFFRINAGSGPGPLATPETPPAMPCAPLPASAAPPELILAGTRQGEIPGLPPEAGSPTMVEATFEDQLEIRTVGDACARSWVIQADIGETRTSIDLGSQENPTSDPFQFAQNRWRLRELRSGPLQITATMTYSADVQVTRRWFLAVSAPDVPAMVFRASDGSSVPAARGCPDTWEFPSGAGGDRTCTGTAIIDPIQVLNVPAGSPVRLEVADGWTISNWSGSCGGINASDVARADPFFVIDGCDLGGSVAPMPAVFLPRANAPVIRLNVTLERKGVSASVGVYVEIRTLP